MSNNNSMLTVYFVRLAINNILLSIRPNLNLKGKQVKGVISCNSKYRTGILAKCHCDWTIVNHVCVNLVKWACDWSGLVNHVCVSGQMRL